MGKVTVHERQHAAEMLANGIKAEAGCIYETMQVSKKMRDFSFNNWMSASVLDKDVSEIHSRAKWMDMGARVNLHATPIPVWVKSEKGKGFENGEAFDIRDTTFWDAKPEGGISRRRIETLEEIFERGFHGISLCFGETKFGFSLRDKEVGIPNLSEERTVKAILYGTYRIELADNEWKPDKKYLRKWLPQRPLSEDEKKTLATAASCTAGFMFDYEWKLPPKMEAAFQKDARMYIEATHELSRVFLKKAFDVISEHDWLRK